MKNKRITVTGGKGFLGTHLVKKFRDNGYENVLIADLPEYNFVKHDDITRMYDELQPDSVIH